MGIEWPSSCKLIGMAKPLLAILGDLDDERLVLDRAAKEFGWDTVSAGTPEELANSCEKARVVGVVVASREGRDPEAWRVWSNGAKVRPILCWRPAERLEQHQLAEWNAYDALLLPLRFVEVRRSLGFLAQAVARDAGQIARQFAPALQRAPQPRPSWRHSSATLAAAS